MHIRRYNPHILSRTLTALFIWTAIVGGVRYIANPASLSFSPVKPSSGIASVSHPTIFQPTTTSGHSGQLLPPGTMASDRTYPNGYARGQCTWYVAGRRQVPGNWGNAASWYYHAVGSGWSVGTTPAVAAIAWTPAGYFGHVALVEQVSADGKQVYISEMNYRGVGIKSYRWVAASAFKYIY
jgi:surface antigen